MSDEPTPQEKPKMADEGGNGKLYAELERLRAEVARLEADNGRLTTDYNTTLEAFQEHLDKAGELEARIAELEPEAAKAPELLNQLRGVKHQGKFKELAEKLGVRKEAVDDLWKLGDWKAEDDEPDEKKMSEHFSKLLEGRDYLKGSSSKLPVDENGNRGTHTPKGDGKIRATKQQLNDPDWMTKNMAAIAADPSSFEIV